MNAFTTHSNHPSNIHNNPTIEIPILCIHGKREEYKERAWKLLDSRCYILKHGSSHDGYDIVIANDLYHNFRDYIDIGFINPN
jgi:hypothetical protein